MYILAENPPLDDATGEESSPTSFTLERRPTRWNLCDLKEKTTIPCPVMGGLVVHKRFFSDEEIEGVRCLARAVADRGDSIGKCSLSTPRGISWFEYHQGRSMFPFQPYPAVNPTVADGVLSRLESQNKLHPSVWPNLGDWADKENDDDSRVNLGANALIRLQLFIERGRLAPEAKEEPCLFLQVQHLERGGQVGAHVDDLAKGGKVISTAVISGFNDIRVGNRIFRVEPGDVYALAGRARYDVDHEVLACPDDRLSVTLRFGLNPETRA